jgi:hypothetical protein
MKSAVLFCLAAFCQWLPLNAQPDTQTFKINAPVAALSDELGKTINNTTEPYKSGILKPQDAPALLQALKASAANLQAGGSPDLQVSTDVVTIIHLLRWKDTDHTTIDFEKWYLYDPDPSKTSFYVQTAQQVFERSVIPGRTKYQLLYIHLNSDLTNASEAVSNSAAGLQLANPVSYTVTVTKQPTQFIQDLKSVLGILGFTVAPAPAAAIAKPGYWSAAPFTSASTTSKITIAASLNSKGKTGDPATGKTTNQLSSKTYTNEKPAWVGLGFAVPVKGYKDVTYSQSSSTLTPQTVTRQTVALTFDLFVPPSEPGLTTFRYIPHLLFGLPIKGKVLQHTFLGAGIGLHWLSPYAAVVFNTNSGAITGTNPKPGHLVLKGAFGLEISVSSAAGLLKGK